MRLLLPVAALFVLAACTPVASPAAGTTSPTAASPSASPTPTVSPLPTVRPTFAGLPGLTPMRHPGFPGLVFLVDANRWADDLQAGSSPADPNLFLQYKSNPTCRLEAVSDTKIPVPALIDLEVMRGRVFHVFEYPGYSLYESRRVYFRLVGVDDLECQTVLETLLADVVDASEFAGGATPTAHATPAPSLGGAFACDALPPLLRPGETAYIGDSGVWLRGTPELGPNNRIKLFPKHAPVLVDIRDGPVCASGYAYWQVTVAPIGGSGESYSGWMAESNALTYVLFDWNP